MDRYVTLDPDSPISEVARNKNIPTAMQTDSRPPGRLRAQPRNNCLHIVLVEPEIPPNTGNIARLAAATCCPLHLVGKLGFRIDEHSVRRAGLDYWHLVDVRQHETLGAAEVDIFRQSPSPRSWLFSGKARKSYLDVNYRYGDALVFGKESSGLDGELLAERGNQVVGIPTLGGVRSLNLANAVAIAIYEALRQLGTLDVTQNVHQRDDQHR
jgi:tRNA (cytidine/uridine-2'-O-)-methyltransferase